MKAEKRSYRGADDLVAGLSGLLAVFVACGAIQAAGNHHRVMPGNKEIAEVGSIARQ
jgi:hypothetical protein